MPALHDRAVIKVAVLDVIDGIAEYSLCVGLTIHGFVDARSRGGGNYQKRPGQIGGLEGLSMPFDFFLFDPICDAVRNSRRNHTHGSPCAEQARNLPFSDATAADYDDQAISQLDEYRKETHRLSFHSLRYSP